MGVKSLQGALEPLGWSGGALDQLLSSLVRTSVQVMLGSCWVQSEAKELGTFELESAPATFQP